VFFARAREPTPFELKALDLSSPPLGFVGSILYTLFVTTIDWLHRCQGCSGPRSFFRVEGGLGKSSSPPYKNNQAFPPFSPFRAIIHPRVRSTPPLGHYVDHCWIASRTTMFKAVNAGSPPRSPFILSLDTAAQSYSRTPRFWKPEGLLRASSYTSQDDTSLYTSCLHCFASLSLNFGQGIVTVAQVHTFMYIQPTIY